jgi:hypothetical protein
MKIHGREIKGPNVEIIPIPRGEGGDIIFRARAVLDLSEFHRLCPIPEPPKVMGKGGTIKLDVDDKNYKRSIDEYADRRSAYMVVASLAATDGLEWDTVSLSDPNTWTNYERELRDSGFSDYEVKRIVIGVMQANALDDKKIEEARERFLLEASQAKLESSSQKDGQKSTPSSGPASASA